MPPAPLTDSLLRAIAAHVDAGKGLAIAVATQNCCAQGYDGGPAECVCWRPVFDLDQADPDRAAAAELAAGTRHLSRRDTMCGDCAYRPDSPEKRGDEAYQGGAAELDDIARASTFFCHDGLRQPIAWVHPAGLRLPVPLDGNYQPPIIDKVPYRASGQPAMLCAGWHARRRALTGRTHPGPVEAT